MLHEIDKQQPAELPQKSNTTLVEWQLSEEMLQQIDTFVDLLLDWNQVSCVSCISEASLRCSARCISKEQSIVLLASVQCWAEMLTLDYD